MSDDEYYDDDDDWYWYEDDSMGLGDELAETAVHSPIMVEDPSLETVDTYSDWEYYSDDYYDDDPTVMTKQRSEGGGEPHKKKRKLSTLENIPNLSLGSSVVDYPTAMTSSFKGVLWRLPVNKDEKVELYEPGKGEKVAVLSNWREVFKAPLHRNDRLSNGAKTNEHEDEAQCVDKQDSSILPASTAEPPEFGERSTDVGYARYSPPPVAIENMDESISRQREKQSQSDLAKPASHPLAETMIIADSEDNIDEAISSPVAVAEVDVVDEDKENVDAPEKKEQTRHKMSVRVEIPTLAAVLKQDSANKSTPRKRGRKPKSSPTTITTKLSVTTEKNNKQPVSKPAQTPKQAPTKNGHAISMKKRKKPSEADLEEEEPGQTDGSNKRRSKRVASSTTSNIDRKAAQVVESDKKRARTTSLTSSMDGRGKRRRV